MRTSLESVCRKRCKKGSGPNPGVQKSAKENREEWPKDCGQDGHDSIRKESKDAEKSPRGRQRSARRTRPAGGCWRQALGLMNSEAGWRWLTGGGEVGSRELRVWMTPKALTVKGGRGIGWWLEEDVASQELTHMLQSTSKKEGLWCRRKECWSKDLVRVKRAAP